MQPVRNCKKDQSLKLSSKNQSDKNKDQGYLCVGRVHSTQGLKGEIFIDLFAGEADWQDQWTLLYLAVKTLSRPEQFFKILNKRVHRKRNGWGFVLKLQFIDDIDGAQKLVGQRVFIPKKFLVSEDAERPYLYEILGFRVFDQQRGDVGRVVGFSGSSMQNTVIVSGPMGEFEVPFVSPIHKSTNRKKKELIMDIPQGLVNGEQ